MQKIGEVPLPIKRKRQCLVGLLILLAVTFVSALLFGRLPANATVSVVSHAHDAGEMLITVVTTNTGRIPLVFYGRPPFAQVRAETPHDWTNVPQRHISQSGSIGFLLPGRSLTARYPVPMDATQVQVGSSFDTAGAQSSVAGWLFENGWWNRAHRVWGIALMLLPDGRREEVEFWSPITKISEREQ